MCELTTLDSYTVNIESIYCVSTYACLYCGDKKEYSEKIVAEKYFEKSAKKLWGKRDVFHPVNLNTDGTLPEFTVFVWASSNQCFNNHEYDGSFGFIIYHIDEDVMSLTPNEILGKIIQEHKWGEMAHDFNF